jgi:hypothetical protein
MPGRSIKYAASKQSIFTLRLQPTPVHTYSQHYSPGQDCLASVKPAQIAFARGSKLFNGTRQRNFRAEASRLLESAPGQIVS